MAIELRNARLQAETEVPIQVVYNGEVIGEYFADLLVEGRVMVEIKAKRSLIAEDEAQLLNYLKATTYEVGLLLNFGPEAQIKRKAYDNSRKGSLSWTKTTGR